MCHALKPSDAMVHGFSVAAFGKASFGKASSRNANPHGLLRATPRLGSVLASAAPPTQTPTDDAHAKVKALLTQSPKENSSMTNARELVHGLLHKEQ
jgi:hypothetical protein